MKPEKSFWVVEKYILEKLHYWSAGAAGRGHGDGWSLDIAFATKFADSESADQVMCHLCDKQGRSAEHSFLSTAGQLADTSRFMADNGL